MYTSTYNRQTKVYDIFAVNPQTGEKRFTGAHTSKVKRGIALLSLNYPAAYRKALRVFGKDALHTLTRLQDATQMYANGERPTPVGMNRWLVRSQEQHDSGRTYTVVTSSYYACNCDDFVCRAGLPTVGVAGNQVPVCKHLALVMLSNAN